MNADVQEFLDDFSPEVQAIAGVARTHIRSLVPEAQEKLTKGYKSIGFGAGTKMREQFVALVLHKAHVNLQFFDGVELSDPAGLLEGTGKRMRHIKLREPEAIQQEPVEALILEAAERVGAD